jgi:hypothetical protein
MIQQVLFILVITVIVEKAYQRKASFIHSLLQLAFIIARAKYHGLFER